MRTRTILSAAAGALGVLTVMATVSPASADWGGHHRRQEWREHRWQEHAWRRHEWRERHWQPYYRPYVYAPPPTYYGYGGW